MIRDKSLFVRRHEVVSLDILASFRRYRIHSSCCDIEVGEGTKRLIDLLAEYEGKRGEEIIPLLAERLDQSEDLVEKTLDLLIRYGLVVFSEEEKHDSEGEYYRNRMETFWWRWRLLDTERHGGFLRGLTFLFSWWVAIPVVFLAIGLLGWLYVEFFSHGGGGFEWRYYSFWDYLLVFYVGTQLKLLWHEIGHAAAMKKYNVPSPDGIGVGFYYFLFVAYTDTHESWNLPRSRRMVVSVAGFYFELMVVVLFFGVLFLTRSAAMRDYLLLFPFTVLSIFNPFLKMDGYWFFSDLLGVTNLQTKLRRWWSFWWGRLFAREFSKGENPFADYPRWIEWAVMVYGVFFVGFMLFFFGGFLFKIWLPVALSWNEMLFEPAKQLIGGHLAGGEMVDQLNRWLRYAGIFVGGVMFFVGWGVRLPIKILQSAKINREESST